MCNYFRHGPGGFKKTAPVAISAKYRDFPQHKNLVQLTGLLLAAGWTANGGYTQARMPRPENGPRLLVLSETWQSWWTRC